LSTPISYKRPLGVTIRGILYLIEGAIAIFCGVLLSTIIQYITTYLNSFSDKREISVLLKILDGSLSHVLIIWLIVAGSAGIIIGIGILKGKRWAWKITIVQTLFNVSVGVLYFALPNTSDLAGNIIGTILEIIIGAVIIYYFYRPHVRAYFNKMSPQ
jgi:hypothetical protein